MESFLFQASIYLAAAIIAVPIAARLGLGSVLGYLLAGILIGPVLQLVGNETRDLQHFAEFGVVMMLFLIGLELEPRALWDMRHRLLGLGGLQILLTTGAITGAVALMGQPWPVALAVGMTLALSSTAIVLQTLSEKGWMQTGGGRSAFSVLLTQDIAVIPMLALMPLLAITGVSNNIRKSSEPEDAVNFLIAIVRELPGWGVTLLTLAVVASIILGGIFLTRPIFRFINAARLREIHTALALLIVVGIASLMTIVGLSPALGAFLAGVVLASSEFRHELESDIEPFKGLLLGLFFITVGAGMDFQILWGDPLKIIGLTLALMLLKGVVLFALGKAFKLKGRDQWMFTLGLAQAGEFGFVLISFGLQQNVVPVALSATIFLMIALSMLLTPLAFMLLDFLAQRRDRPPSDMDHDEIDEQGPIIIAGIGRFGQIVHRLVAASGFQTTVLDHDLDTIELMRRFGVKGFFGDPTRPELLHAAGLDKAKVLVVALDDPAAALKLVVHARRERPDLHIVARAKGRDEVFRLFQAGADDIVRETFDSSLRAGRYVLENVGLSEYEAAEAEKTFYKHDRYSIQELAVFWDPDIPVGRNKAFVARARELHKSLETALLTQRRTAASEQPPPKGDRSD